MRLRIRSAIYRLDWKKVAIFALLFSIFVLNTFHEEYPDEYDSIVGGKFITEGKLPYKDWFQHHQPGAYVLAALLLPFSGISFVRFRVLLAVAFFLINVGAYFLLKRRMQRDLNFYLVFLFLTAISATYFWGQMLLADTLASYLIVPAFVLVLFKGFYREKFEQRDLAFFSIFAFLAWFTSLTYTYLLGGLYVYAIYLHLRTKGLKEPVKGQKKAYFLDLAKAVGILVGPFVLYFGYLLVTGSLGDWYFANITYNQNYYIYNYPRAPGAPVNPIRYAIIIAHDFFNNFFPILVSVKDFNFSDPLRITLALSSASFFVYLLLKRKYSLLFPFLTVLIYANARSNPFEIRETDYQASVYILTSMFLGVFTLFALNEDLRKNNLVYPFKLVGSLIFLLLGIYWFFNSFFLGLKFFQKYQAKYMGQAPLVYDRPEVTPIVNQLVGKDEYAWVGPFEFKELFYLKAKLPSKYHWFLNHAASEPRIKEVMVGDFERNRPKVIVFKRGYAPWGGDASTFNYFFTDFLDKNYFRLFELSDEDTEYRWKIGEPRDFNLMNDFNFDKERKEEIIQKLLELELIEKIKRIP